MLGHHQRATLHFTSKKRKVLEQQLNKRWLPGNNGAFTKFTVLFIKSRANIDLSGRVVILIWHQQCGNQSFMAVIVSFGVRYSSHSGLALRGSIKGNYCGAREAPFVAKMNIKRIFQRLNRSGSSLYSP